MERLWSQAGATGGNRSQMAPLRKRLKQADRRLLATHGNRFAAHGKEGVDGSSSCIDSNVVNGEPNVPDFLGDSGIPAEAGHYSFHPAAGVAFDLQVAFRPAK
jgi:hypothetical protein